MSPRLLTRKDAADRLAASTATVARLEREGLLPAIRPTGRRLVGYRPEDVERLIAAVRPDPDAVEPADGASVAIGKAAGASLLPEEA